MGGSGTYIFFITVSGSSNNSAAKILKVGVTLLFGIIDLSLKEGLLLICMR